MRQRNGHSRPGTAQGDGGFSLVEITLAMGIAAVAMVSILGMLPQAMKYSRDSADQTAIGAVLEDAHDRIKGSRLEEGEVAESPLFYDQQGRFWSPDQARPGGLIEERFFRVEVTLSKPRPIEGLPEPPEGMMAATVTLSWPLDESGQPRGIGNPRTSVTYMVTSLTGPDWEAIDPDYRPRLEY